MGIGTNILKKEIRWTLLALLAYILIPVIVNLPYLISGNVMSGGDSFSFLNNRSLFAYGFHSGDAALWNPYSMLGAPFMADIQSGFFYPLNYLALIFPENVFGNIFYICTLALAGFFMYLFMTEMVKSKLVAFLTGLIFMFSTILGNARVAHQTVYSSIIWLPLVLYFIQRYIRTNNRKELLLSSVAMALQVFAGFPQVAVYSDIFVFLYLIIFMQKEKNSFKKRVVDLVLWLGIFVMLIAVQFIPLAELIKDSGRNAVPYEFFSVYSADYKVLPMVLFPELFVDIYAPFGIYHAMEIGIEIYMGIFVIVFTVYAVIFHMKDKKIRWFVILAVLALLYCMVGNLPIIGRLVWKIPILGSFRAASRMLFISVFFCISIFGIVLSKLNEKAEAKRLLKFSCASFIVILGFILFVKSMSNSVYSSPAMQQYYAGVKQFLPTVIITLLLVGVLAAYCYFKFFYTRKHAYVILASVLCLISIIDVGRYSLKHGEHDYYGEYDGKNSTLQYIEDKEGHDEYRSLAVITSPEELYDTEKAVEYKVNANMLYHFKAFNAYLTFESQKTKDLFSVPNAILMPNLNNIIHSKNSALSMASIKYIADPYGDITKESVISGAGELYEEYTDFNILSNNSSVNAIAQDINIANNQQYYIEFTAATDKTPTFFYIDFYGQNYDLEECSLTLGLKTGTHKYSGVISTGSGKVPEDACIRVVSQSESDIEITNYKVFKVQEVPFDSVYKTLLHNEDTIIYENTNAKPIINVADNVADMLQYNAFKINEISYIENPNAQAVGNDAQVQILEFNNNSIKAKVTATEDVFINHTQVMYPGWNAYVDGKKVQNYLVNKTIQGAYVPEGEHIIEFRFESVSFYFGAIVTLGGIVLLIILTNRKTKK